jgi:hypothetical protein
MRLSMLVNGLANVWLRLRARQGKLKLNTFRLIRAFYRFGPGLLVNRLSHLPALSHVDASGTSQVPGGPSGAFASVLDPGRIDDPSPWPRRCCPLLFRRQRLQHWSYRGDRGASAPAFYASRVMLPPPMQDSLPAGWLAFAGRELNPLVRAVTSLPLSWIYPDGYESRPTARDAFDPIRNAQSQCSNHQSALCEII